MVLLLDEKLLCGFDLETTGVDNETARIVTANITITYPNGKRQRFDWLINPGVEIPKGASDVHGITTEVAQECGVNPAEALGEIANNLANFYKLGYTIVVFNAAYDLPLLNNELRRYGLPTLEQRIGGLVHRVLDPLVIDRAADKYRKGKRTLVAMCPVYGIVPSDNAHDAGADVGMTLDLMEAMLNTYELPSDDDELYVFQRDAHREWAESFGRWLRRQGKQDTVRREWI